MDEYFFDFINFLLQCLVPPTNINTYPEILDCVVSSWGEWSSCSASCGFGRKERRRLIKVEAQNGGRRCPKRLVQQIRCKIDDCIDL